MFIEAHWMEGTVKCARGALRGYKGSFWDTVFRAEGQHTACGLHANTASWPFTHAFSSIMN